MNLQTGKSQGVGAGIIYNLPTQNIGFELRWEYEFEKFVFAPQAAYYPGIGPINEFYASVSLHYRPIELGIFMPYLLANAGYNGWINHAVSPDPDAKFSNWSAQGGIGLTTNKCTRPYLEYRINAKWNEATLRLGLIYTFNCRKWYICDSYL